MGMEPQMNADECRLNQRTEQIIGCAYKVANTLGHGFLEKVYENALAHELRKAGLHVEQQKSIGVRYDGITVGEYVADLVVAGGIVVELKCARRFDDIHMAQCMNYLRATGLGICLLINFGSPKVEIRRVINSANLYSSAFICGQK
jgi:GxxExxY protein